MTRSPAPWALRGLQVAVALGGCVPVGAGLAGVLMGPAMLEMPLGAAAADSHFRYLSGLLLGIGLAFWGCIPALARRSARVRLLTAIVVLGGLARLYGAWQLGWPAGGSVWFALAMELLVTPLLCLWQRAIAEDD